MIQRFRKKPDAKLELAPLIDIVFILLIFFAVTSSLVSNNKGIPLDLPQAVSSEKNKEGITISITKDEAIFVDKKAVDESQLSEALKEELNYKPDLQVIINADLSLNYAFIIRILDHVRVAGGTNIALQTEKKIYK